MNSSMIQKYKLIPFCKPAPQADFYGFLDLSELRAARRVAEPVVRRCRALGVLRSDGGRFYLTSISDPTNIDMNGSIKVSMVYLKSPPLSTVIPYPVQILGFLKWQPDAVLFAKILQPLPVRMALQLNNLLKDLSTNYAGVKPEGDDEGS